MARDGLRAATAAGADLVVVGSVNDLTQSEAIHGAKRLSRAPAVVALVGHASRAEVGRLLGAGADALLERSVPADELAAALRRLAAGERVLARLAEGRSNQAIAAALHVSPATVKTHLAHIYEKLGASDRNEALVRAVALGLLR
jgi:DNA-binding NarL/FixJ family response regulator